MTTTDFPPESVPRRMAGLRTLLVWASSLLVLMVIASWIVPSARRSAGQRWDVVLVTFDTTRADRIGCYGDVRARTPALDALARDGIAYLSCYTPAPVTLPAHSSLMTGLTPLRHGIHDNGRNALAPDVETLAESLGRQGYATAAFVGAFVLDHQFGLDQGFDRYDDAMTSDHETGLFCYAERNAQLVTDAALAWLADDTSQPQFVWVHFFDPHAPYDAPGFDPTFSSLTSYDAEIHFADAQLKRLVDHIDARQDRPTLLVVAADHGEGLGDHGEVTHGLFVYNSTLHVPLLVRFPDRRHAATRVDTPVSLIDVAPSILDWLDLPALPDADGEPLPLGTPRTRVDEDERRGIYFENEFVANNYGWCPQVGAIWGDMKYIVSRRPELYDLAVDRWEENPLGAPVSEEASQFIRRFAELTGELEARGRFAPRPLSVSQEDLAKLKSLGYVGGSEPSSIVPRTADQSSPDAKDMVAVLERIQLATTAFERERYDEAGEALLEVIANDDPQNPRAVRLLAMLIERSPRLRPRIVAALHEIQQSNGDALDAYALAMLGVGLIDQQQYEAAVGVLAQVVAQEPQHAAAFCYLGDAYWELDQKEEATSNYQRAMNLVANSTDAPDWLERARNRRDQYRANAEGSPTD